MNKQPGPISPRVVVQMLFFIVVIPFLPLLISSRWDWWEAWVYAVICILGFVISRGLAARRNPDLLAERARFMQHEDAKPWDKVLAPLVGLGGGLVPLVAGLDALFGWSSAFNVPVKIVSLLIFLVGYVWGSYALIENRFFSGMVRIQTDRGQHVISSGPYGWMRHPGYAGALFIVLLFFLFNVLSVQGFDWTYDEPDHYKYGMNILHGNSTRFDDSKMPISAWNALPAWIADLLPDGSMKAFLKELSTARLMTTLFSMTVAFMVFYWARELYGWIPALLSLILYVLDPNIIAHSQLVTTDIYITGMLLFSTYWLWRYANEHKWQNGFWLLLTLGLAQLTKYTAVSLFGLFAVALLVYDWSSLKKNEGAKRWQEIRRTTWQYAKYGFFALAFIIDAICCRNPAKP